MYLKKNIAVLAFSLSLYSVPQIVCAQDTQKTIEITSQFKPSLMPASKIGFTATPAPIDSVRPKLQYNIPVQNLSFNFYPAPLKPLAYEYDNTEQTSVNKNYVKAGFGNFGTPFLKAAASFGDGVKSNSMLEGNFTRSKGKLPNQQFAQWGLKGHHAQTISNSQELYLNVGLSGLNVRKYGLIDQETDADILKNSFNSLNLNATFTNQVEKDAAIYYSPSVDINFMGGSRSATDIYAAFSAPFEKKMNEDLSVLLGLKGSVSKFKAGDANFSNNLFMLSLAGKFNIGDNIRVKAGVIPSWSKGEFKLLPDIQTDFLISGSDFIFQAGWQGYYKEQSFQTLIKTNPWIEYASYDVRNTLYNEFYGAFKAVVDNHLSFRVKAGYAKINNMSLFANHYALNNRYYVVNEANMNVFSIAGELSYIKADDFQWFNTLKFNKYGGLDALPNAYGLLPMEFSSNARAKIMKGLYAKADLYGFGGTWYNKLDATSGKLKAGYDLNLGAELNIKSNFDVWLQFSNVFNNNYQRFNLYQNLGFQVMGGIIYRF